MPRLALALAILWFVSLFVFRSVLQWKKTGSTGLKGFHGRVGSLAWIAGVAVALGFFLAVFAPLASFMSWPGGSLLIVHNPLHLAGAVLTLIGIAGALLAQLTMGASWRVGVDEAEKTRLVTDGLFSWVRNPIYFFLGLSGLGLVFLVPSVLSLLAGVITALGIQLQVRTVEEPYLLHAHGEDYARYAAAVGRFLPGLGRLTSSGSKAGVP